MTESKRVTRDGLAAAMAAAEGDFVGKASMWTMKADAIFDALPEPPASADVDAAWEALYAATRDVSGDAWAALDEHRPRIEAAIRAECREREAMDAGKLSGYEDGLEDGRAESEATVAAR